MSVHHRAQTPKVSGAQLRSALAQPQARGSLRSTKGAYPSGVQRINRRRCRVATVCGVRSALSTFVEAPLPAIWAALICTAVTAQVAVLVLESRTVLGSVLSAPLLCMLLAFALSLGGILPVACTAYELVWQYLLPLAAALVLLEADVQRLWSSAQDVLVAFSLGTAATVVGTVASFSVVGRWMGTEGCKLAAALCASYIGGSINFAATAQALQLTPSRLLAGAVADNVAMAIYIVVVTCWPAAYTQPMPDSVTSTKPLQSSTQITGQSVTFSVIAGGAACCVGSWLAAAIGFDGGGLAVTAVVASFIPALTANLQPIIPSKSLYAGGEALGSFLMLLFFATIGAGAGSWTSLASTTGYDFVFIFFQLFSHLVIIMVAGKLLRLQTSVVLTASNALVGGPATAAAMAASRGWPNLVQPAVLAGSLGYAIGTLVGCGVAPCLQAMVQAMKMA